MRDKRPLSLEQRVSLVLRIGMYISSACMSMGFILTAVQGEAPNGSFSRLMSLPADRLALDPAMWLTLGILALMATPVLRIVVAMLGFAREGDSRYVAISGIVLLIISASVIASLVL